MNHNYFRRALRGRRKSIVVKIVSFCYTLLFIARRTYDGLCPC
jgi:hypothetical protein